MCIEMCVIDAIGSPNELFLNSLKKKKKLIMIQTHQLQNKGDFDFSLRGLLNMN